MGMTEITIKIKPGGEAFFLYSDDAPFKKAGNLDLIRASNVLWSKTRQRWLIRTPDGKPMGDPQGYESRMQAIADEVRLLGIALKDGTADEALALGFARYDEIEGGPEVLQGII
jgi:hypothetical protein